MLAEFRPLEQIGEPSYGGPACIELAQRTCEVLERRLRGAARNACGSERPLHARVRGDDRAADVWLGAEVVERLVERERDLTLSTSNAGELHARLLPQLRDVAAARLADRHSDHVQAREILGEEAWELLRDRPVPPDRSAPGLPLRRISALVDAVERL